MKLKWLLYFVLAILVLQGCSKKEGVPVTPDMGYPQIPPPPVDIPQNKDFTVSNVLQNNMVIQRDKPFQVWGTSAAKAQIEVTASWNNAAVTAIADNKGNWIALIPAAPANSNPQTLTCKLSGQPTIALSNLLIGDVWICSGQSNMVMPVDVTPPSFKGVTNYTQEIAAANYPLIRMLNVAADYQPLPANKLTYVTTWDICSPLTVGKISAVGYFFARKLHTTLNVPIGIIISAVNGTSCETWANQYVFDNNKDLASFYSNSNTYLFNGMINPFVNLSVKGFTWYQGENNQNNYPVSNYTKLSSALVQGWRYAFNQGQLPFYFVQLTPFAADYYNTTPVGGDETASDFAKFREAQANILATPGTGMAVTMDVGEADNHHPVNKKPVGERLALLALNKTYSLNVDCVGPKYASFTQSGKNVIINYTAGTANGLSTTNGDPLKQYFFVAGADRVFHQAVASISGNAIVLAVQNDTPLPIAAIRYAFTSAPITNLQNSAGLPAEPFRTDNWGN